jgi:hypothetical protein
MADDVENLDEKAAPTRPLPLQVDPFALKAALGNHLTLTYQRVAIGLNRCSEATLADAELPEVLASFGWAEGRRPTDEWVREDMRTWVLAAGFRDAIEGVTLFLDHVHVFFIKLEVGQRSRITQSELDAYDTRHAKFHKANLVAKLDQLRDSGFVSLPDPVREWLLSLNAARRCLVHRGGRVGRDDLKKGDDSLVVRWRRPRLLLIGPEGERDLEPGLVREGEGPALRLEDVVREFKVGQRVSFTVADFSEIVFTLSAYFSQPVMVAVVDSLKAAGLVTPDGEVVKR